MQLVANLLEGLLSTCFTIPTSSTSDDTTSGTTAPVAATPAPDLKRTVSVTSSSGLDQVESEVAPSESVSSTAFSQIQQVWYYNKTLRLLLGIWQRAKKIVFICVFNSFFVQAERFQTQKIKKR